LDLEAVPHINSAALNTLVRITAQANTRGGGVGLINPTPFVAGVLEITRLNEFLRIYATLDEAIEHIRV
jgi:anti-anti-sigma factor